MPDEKAVRVWSMTAEHPINPHFAHARELGYLKMADELVEISDDSRNDYMDRISADGEVTRVIDQEAMARSRLRLDTRKWVLSKMLPKVYGDKVSQEHKVSFSDQFETYIRSLNERAQAKIIDGTVAE
jgi:hypothetical protein